MIEEHRELNVDTEFCSLITSYATVGFRTLSGRKIERKIQVTHNSEGFAALCIVCLDSLCCEGCSLPIPCSLFSERASPVGQFLFIHISDVLCTLTVFFHCM